MKAKFSILIAFIFLSGMTNAQINISDKLYKPGHVMRCATFSPDSRYVATGGNDKKVIVWEANTSRIIYELEERGVPLALKFTPDGKYLISAGYAEKVNVWDMQSGELINSLQGHRDEILDIDISPDGKYVASASVDRLIKLWDINNGILIRDFKGHRSAVSAVKFSPNGDKLLTGSADHMVKEWTVSNGYEISSIKAHGGWVRSVDYSPDGSLIASSGDDRKIQIWRNGQIYNTLIAHKSYVSNVSFSPGGKYLLSSSFDQMFIVWDVVSGRMVFSSDKQGDKIFDAKFSPDGSKIVTANYSHMLSVWDARNLNILGQQGTPIYFAQNESTLQQPAQTYQPVEQKPIEKQPVQQPVVQPVTPVVNPAVIDVDQISPIGVSPNQNRYALIVGNEDYSSYQLGLKSESNVDYAVRDAEVFKKYAVNVLGIPEENIIFQTNARAIEMHRAVNKINVIAGITKGKAEIFFYYAGHGFPDELTQEPFLIPVDVSGSDLDFALSLNEVYAKLTEHPVKNVTVFLDACFSGGARNQGLVAARGVKIVPKENVISGNMVVFSASSGDQSSLPYHNMKHGMFTYYLLKKMQETKGQVTYRDLSSYLKEQVGVKSVLINNKEQSPQTNVSMDIQGSWGDLKLR